MKKKIVKPNIIVQTLSDVEKSFSSKGIDLKVSPDIRGGICEYCGIHAMACPHYGSFEAVSSYLKSKKDRKNSLAGKRMNSEMNIGLETTSAAVFED